MLVQIQGCANLSVQNLPPEFSLVKIGTCEVDTPYEPSPDGEWLALVQKGLKLLKVKTDQEIQLSNNTPVKLAWNHSSDQLIAAFTNSQKSTLQVYGTDSGEISQAIIDGTLSDMAWGSENLIIIATIIVRNYSFGSTLITKLWQWDKVDTPKLISESSVTIKPHFAKLLEEKLDKTAKLAVSPLGDTILYTKLITPPVVKPYMKMVMLHLETGTEREVAKAELTLGEMFLLDEDMVLFSDGINKVNLLDPWTGKKVKQFQEAGNKLSVSKEGQYVLVDGKLFDKNKQIATFSPTVDGVFSKKGHLFLRFQNQFYLLSGLEEEKRSPLAQEKQRKLLKIRKWRSQSLITNKEFQLQKKRILEK